MKEILLLLMILFLISGIYSQCNETQININTALAEELDEIVHVGPKVAGYIIEQRPFNSLDELINVNYISSGYLEDIIDQGLACVEQTTNETEQVEENQDNTKDEKIIVNDFNDSEKESEEADEPKKPITFDTISLTPSNPKDIKSSNHEEKSEKSNSNYAIYGFIVFCILIAILFMLKIKRKKFSEFI